MNNQNSELQKVKDRIKALTKKTVEQGCSEQEAIIAMTKVGQLLEQYNLSMSEIDLREQVCKTIFIKANSNNRGPIDSCVTALADFFDGVCWFSKNYRRDPVTGKRLPSQYGFFGTETDMEMIQYMFDVVSKAIETETDNFKKSALYYQAYKKKTATVSFGRGMAARINERLRTMKKEIDAKQAAVATTGTSLIALKGQLVNDEFKNTGIKLGRAPTRYIYNDDSVAHVKGREAGDRVNLHRPIETGSKISGLLS